jgi:hypothetical protein
MSSDIIITCKQVVYFSSDDEALFFSWLSKIGCIEKIEGFGEVLQLHIKPTVMSYNDLKNLIGVCYRYKIDMRQLAQFVTHENEHWFASRSAPWHYKIFRSTRRT